MVIVCIAAPFLPLCGALQNTRGSPAPYRPAGAGLPVSLANQSSYIYGRARRVMPGGYSSSGWICTPRSALSSASGSWVKSLLRLQGFL